MNDYVGRTLSYLSDKGEIEQIDDGALTLLDRPMIILGEPGMGKTYLLRQIAQEPGWGFRSAASFVAHPDPASLVPTGHRLVIDGLDELSAAQESDPVYRVLGQLIRAGCPPFILSCRAADWRGAVARQDISEEYGAAPIELTLNPFTEEKAISYLTPRLGAERASDVVAYLDDKGIPDLWGNPLTLNLFGEVAERQNDLPETRAKLMRAATEIMWNERSDRHDGSPLSNMDGDTALLAAGAAFAAYVLTGSEAIALKPSSAGLTGVLPISELQALPEGNAARVLVGSRLFSRITEEEDRFKPVHRSVAEYLGAHWLSAKAKDELARERVLAMMTIDSGVPASLRGIHAWLAQDGAFALRVIETDPYGVLRYGDPDDLSVSEGRALLKALKTLERTNPYFRAEDWGNHSAKGLTHLELLDDVRAILVDEDTSFHLRTLLLGAIKGSDLAAALAGDLHRMIQSKPGEYGYGERHAAAQAVIALDKSSTDWPAVIASLINAGDEDSTRLALEIMDDVGFELIGSSLVARAVLAHLGLLDDGSAEEIERSTTGTLYLVARNLPGTMVADVLDAIAAHVSPGDVDADYREHAELADTLSRLISRQLEIAPPAPLVLLKWLRVAPGRHGYSRDDQERLAKFIQNAAELRRAIQRHVIFVETDHNSAWGRIWRLSDVNGAFALSAEDAVHFLLEMDAAADHTDTANDQWRDLAAFARRSDGRAREIIEAARLYAVGHPDLETFLEDLQKPQAPPEWQVKEDARRDAAAAKRKAAWAQHRKDFTANLAAVRAGELRWSHPIAQAYLGLYRDMEREAAPADRIGHWLGPEVQEAGLEGLEAVLHRDDLPTLEQIAQSYAESKRWNFVHPMIAGVVERVMSGRGIEDIATDVLLSVRIALDNEHLGERIDQEAVTGGLDASLRRDPAIYERYIRLLIEPSLIRRCNHITGLYGFIRSADDRPLAVRLAAEWLERFDALPVGVEGELIYVLTDAGAYDVLRAAANARAAAGYDTDERRRAWLAVGLICDFEKTRSLVEPIPESERTFLWFLRDIFRGGRHDDGPVPNVGPAVWGWIVAQFRSLWPYRERKSGVSSGDTNDWDATELLRGLINRLASDTSAAAADVLAGLIAGAQDGYTPHLLHAADQQRRARREISFPGVSLDRLRDVVRTQVPKTSDDLLAIIRHTLARVQAELNGNDTDSIVKYWRDDGQPRNEDRCTDALAEDVARLLPDLGIMRVPQADMPNGKIADLLYMVGAAGLPIECKGQWNPKLWTAAGDQLDAFYVRDWRVQDRGVYLVYWFGADVAANFKLRAPPARGAKPETPEQLRDALVASIAPARRGSISVEVLDLTR